MDGSFMELFTKKRGKGAGAPAYAPQLDEKLKARVLDFARSVETLHAPLDVCIRLVCGGGTGGRWGRSKQPLYYLLIYAAELPYAYLNAGYIAGQTLAYLRFMGIPASIPEMVPVWARPEEGRSCLAAVAFGGKSMAEYSSASAKEEEFPCICHDYQERWPEEVLRYTKKRFPASLRAVRIVREDDRLSIVPRMISGKREAMVQREAGLAAARIMSAAEELWIDLSFADADGQRCIVSVCRRKDLAKLGKNAQERRAVGTKAALSYS